MDRSMTQVSTTIENRLRGFGDARVDLRCFKAERDVHALIAIAAAKLAEQQWRVAGARSASQEHAARRRCAASSRADATAASAY